MVQDELQRNRIWVLVSVST